MRGIPQGGIRIRPSEPKPGTGMRSSPTQQPRPSGPRRHQVLRRRPLRRRHLPNEEVAVRPQNSDPCRRTDACPLPPVWAGIPPMIVKWPADEKASARCGRSGYRRASAEACRSAAAGTPETPGRTLLTCAAMHSSPGRLCCASEAHRRSQRDSQLESRSRLDHVQRLSAS